MADNIPIVPFGKYKGQSIVRLLQDKNYLDWCRSQEWLKKYSQIYNICISGDINAGDQDDSNINDEKVVPQDKENIKMLKTLKVIKKDEQPLQIKEKIIRCNLCRKNIRDKYFNCKSCDKNFHPDCAVIKQCTKCDKFICFPCQMRGKCTRCDKCSFYCKICTRYNTKCIKTSENNYPNLNNIYSEFDTESPDYPKDFIKKGNIVCYTNNLKKYLLEYIKNSDCIVGCVAWLTDKDILKALHGKLCLIVVQKEDFLRPDCKDFDIKELRELYDNIGCLFWHIGCGFLGEEDLDTFKMLHGMSTNGCNGTCNKAIRCVGNYSPTRDFYIPKMHNKFLVFYHKTEGHTVWTGSMNLINGCEKGFENAVYIKDKDVAEYYSLVFERIFTLSEPLDWTSKWCEPEYRIGT
jgi:hypothetical protein